LLFRLLSGSAGEKIKGAVLVGNKMVSDGIRLAAELDKHKDIFSMLVQLALNDDSGHGEVHVFPYVLFSCDLFQDYC
jgi:hypothetical protein